VRMALGATSGSVVGLVVGRTLRLAFIGVGVGLLGAYFTGGFMARLMFGVSPGNPAILTSVSAILVCTTIVASWLPGRGAARIDTVRALSGD
jgi:ABC-type antimicrobial peptide transport system permease subunit